MIWERTPSGENVERLAALGLRSAVVAPCDNVPQESNFMHVMRQNIMNLQRVLADPP